MGSSVFSQAGSRMSLLHASRTLLSLVISSSPLFMLIPAFPLDPTLLLRLGFLLLAAVLGGLMLPLRNDSPVVRMLLVLLITTSLFAAGKWFSRVTDYPFSLTWSEGNHLWDSALFFGLGEGSAVGPVSIPNYVTPGLYGLRGLPFILNEPPLWALRLWDAVLWVLPGLVFGYLLATRSRLPQGWFRVGFSLWTFLFLMQGPVYAPLLLAAIAVVVGVSADRPWITAGLTAAACLYAGLSRWTWMLAPMLWSLLLLMGIDREILPRSDLTRRPPSQGMILGASTAGGLIGAALSQILAPLITGWPALMYYSGVRQPLLWYRLLPNPTFPLGLLPALLLTTGPLVVCLGWGIHRHRREVGGTLMVFAAAGLMAAAGVGVVASLKIGGGDNLHHLDMYFITLLILVALLVKLTTREGNSWWGQLPVTIRVSSLAVLLIPVFWTVRSGAPLELPPRRIVDQELNQFTETILEKGEDAELLFIDQRHMLAMEPLDSVPWVPEYELIELMDYAMAGDVANLQPFYKDLETRRFDLIVSDPLPVVWKGREYSFGEENDAWVRYITLPILEHYAPTLKLESGVWLLRPRTSEEET